MAPNKTFRLLPCSALAILCACGLRAQQLTKPEPPAVSGALEFTQPKSAAERMPRLPKVHCQGGQLSISAQNSTLSSILAAVHACLGVEVDIPNGAADERSFLELGPGPTREVLDALLSSTDYNYAIQSSNSAPDKILAILLMAQTKDGTDSSKGKSPILADNSKMSPARRAWLQSRGAGRPIAAADGEAESNSAEPEAVTPPEPDASSAILPAPAETIPVALTGGREPSKDADNSGKAVAPDAAVVADATNSTTSPGPSPDSAAAKEFRNKVDEMQQLFEQRKKLVANPTTAPN